MTQNICKIKFDLIIVRTDAVLPFVIESLKVSKLFTIIQNVV